MQIKATRLVHLDHWQKIGPLRRKGEMMKKRVLWVMLLLSLVAIVGLGGASGIGWSAESDAPTTQQGGPPPIKHTVTDPAGCTRCHDAKGVRPLPASHDGRTAQTCSACHQPAAGSTDVNPAASTDQKASSQTPGQECVTCHGQRGTTLRLESGEVISAYVDARQFAESVHGNKLSCVSCHQDKSGYPHERKPVATLRAYISTSSAQCASCHQSANEEYLGSVHGKLAANGDREVAACVDCHDSHDVKKASTISYDFATCAKCHLRVTESYGNSVHGKLVTSGKRDAATCVDCHTSSSTAHGLQKVGDPASVTAPQNVAETCGKCHQKALETYSTTFHGKAMRLGITQSAATCTDCHGAYGVQRVHGPEAPIDNYQVGESCAKCHEGANENFAAGWMGHEEASPNWFPLVYFTERFLFYLTTSVVAFGIIHVELDLLRWFVSGRKQHKKNKGEKDDNENS